MLNPSSGSCQGRRVYRRLAAPAFAAAGIKAAVRETRHPGPAGESVAGLTLEQLRGIDGACVGAALLGQLCACLFEMLMLQAEAALAK